MIIKQLHIKCYNQTQQRITKALSEISKDPYTDTSLMSLSKGYSRNLLKLESFKQADKSFDPSLNKHKREVFVCT